VTDWQNESDFSDSGFSEAAADAFFAALVQLDKDADIFGSPLHFIGHSRGTVVNSEIIQRLGKYREDIRDIHMTSLDTHDFEQLSLNFPLTELSRRVAEVVAAAAGAVGAAVAGPAAGLRAALLLDRTLKAIVDFVLKGAGRYGIQANPLPYATFQDPEVKVWTNVAFADNYVQKGAKEEANHITLTPNGRQIPQADIDLLLDPLAGFGKDDYKGSTFLGGVTRGSEAFMAGP
jgi:hypothetical protein